MELLFCRELEHQQQKKELNKDDKMQGHYIGHKEARTANIIFAKTGVLCIYESLVQGSN